MHVVRSASGYSNIQVEAVGDLSAFFLQKGPPRMLGFGGYYDPSALMDVRSPLAQAISSSLIVCPIPA